MTLREKLLWAFREAIMWFPSSKEDNSWRVKRNVETSEPRFEELLDNIFGKGNRMICVSCGGEEWIDGDYPSLEKCKSCGFQTDWRRFRPNAKNEEEQGKVGLA